ncbi:hypothetical protein D5F52_26575 (plasmid) [Brevibacillus laterosporus]|uniref:hypothetical protein n=1 Tax=Brevibacillus laterosporus TaxID=1465 RepID=UPI000E6BFDDA|nr:hypothetical protein [Brevibacillus laterosporus]AYB41722.1 hypothetical protein D5F52_26575 [Brevibacillus laterosporus]
MLTGCFEVTRHKQHGLLAVSWLLNDNDERIWEFKVPVKEYHSGAYIALNALLEEINERDIKAITILGSNHLVMNQMSGVWRVKNSKLYDLWLEAKTIYNEIPHIHFEKLVLKKDVESQQRENTYLKFDKEEDCHEAVISFY